RVHLREVPLAPDVDPRVLARGTPGFSGADLANLVNEGALLAARRGKRVVTMNELEDATDKVTMVPQPRSMAMSDEDKYFSSYGDHRHLISSPTVQASDLVHKSVMLPCCPTMVL